MAERVTAVITTHKREPEIVERALKSVLAQTHPDMEVIVVDDSPAEFSQREAVRQMVQGYGVTYIPHETCRGACVARNTGLARATGSFVAFLDDDDEWKPEKIALQLAAFTDETIALAYCSHELLDETTGSRTVQEHECHVGRVYETLIYDNFIGSTSFPLLRTAALREIGGFDPLMLSAQDYDVWLRLAEKYAVAYVDQPLVIYHVHAGEQISKSFKKKIGGMERINEKNAAYLKKNKTARWIRTIKLVPMYAGDGQLKKALASWLKMAFTCPGKVKGNLRYLVRIFKSYRRRNQK
jgi:glycosyltransferase involved in cell wall biosynthesis